MYYNEAQKAETVLSAVIYIYIYIYIYIRPSSVILIGLRPKRFYFLLNFLTF